MPLTRVETDFLAAYTFEYMRGEFGPASRRLRDAGFRHEDLATLLDAYIRSTGLQSSEIPDGSGDRVEGFGRYHPDPPAPPWPDRETARRRNAELLTERDADGNR